MVTGQSALERCVTVWRGVDRVAFMHAKAYQQFLNEIGLMEIDRVIHGVNLESNIPICRFLLAFEAFEYAGDERLSCLWVRGAE